MQFKWVSNNQYLIIILCALSALAFIGRVILHDGINGNIQEYQKHTVEGRFSQYTFNDYLSYPENVPLQIKCESCAYVTGSGHLRGSKLGKEIDSSDCVIRSNDSPTKGFEADVGIKTTIRTVDRNSLQRIASHVKKGDGFDPSVKGTVFMLYGYPDERHLREKVVETVKSKMTWFDVYLVTNNRFQRMLHLYDNRIEKNNHKIWFTNGFVTILFLRDICKDIHVYGVTNSTHCDLVQAGKLQSAPYHYYPVESKDKECDFMHAFDRQKSQTHHFTNEKRLFEQLRLEWGNLQFHAPEW